MLGRDEGYDPADFNAVMDALRCNSGSISVWGAVDLGCPGRGELDRGKPDVVKAISQIAGRTPELGCC